MSLAVERTAYVRSEDTHDKRDWHSVRAVFLIGGPTPHVKYLQ
jgi:hypothetical protein